MTSKNKFKRILAVVAVLLVILAGAFIYYVQDYYEANEPAVDLMTSTEEIEVLNDDPIHFVSSIEDTDIGIIFYPGGKVDEVASTPLLQPLAEVGHETFIVDMPFHLAVFDVNAADDIILDNPEIKEWYVGGHSLGAAMAAVYAEKNADKLAGLFLLAGYSTADLSASNLPVLALYGSEDEVIDLDTLAENRPNLPTDTIEVEIPGGNHAQFGLYG